MGIIIYTLYIHHKAEGHQVRILCTQVSYSFHIPGFVLSSYWLLLWAPRDYQPKFRCRHLFSCLRKLRLEIRGTMPEHSARISLHQYISNWIPFLKKQQLFARDGWQEMNEGLGTVSRPSDSLAILGAEQVGGWIYWLPRQMLRGSWYVPLVLMSAKSGTVAGFVCQAHLLKHLGFITFMSFKSM